MILIQDGWLQEHTTTVRGSIFSPPWCRIIKVKTVCYTYWSPSKSTGKSKLLLQLEGVYSLLLDVESLKLKLSAIPTGVPLRVQVGHTPIDKRKVYPLFDLDWFKNL